MNVSLTPELEKFVQNKVTSGMYFSASEVIREGLRLLRDQDDNKARKLRALQQKIDRGIAQLERGEGIAGEAAWEELQKISRERRRRR